MVALSIDDNKRMKKNKKKKRTQAQSIRYVKAKDKMMLWWMKIKMKKKMKKKMKMEMKMVNRCSNANANAKGKKKLKFNNAIVIDDDFVVYEILVRLPVKTLMRFKSVCKSWMSSIQYHPKFHQLHFEHSETCRLGLFIVNQKQDHDHESSDVPGHREYFLSASSLIKGTGATAAARLTLQTFRKRDKSSYYEEILDPVKGLVCLANVFEDAVCVYNPSTREETQWIKTTLRRRRSDSSTMPRFAFGFDPVSNKHKVICHRTLDLHLRKYACEVLTLGDNSWRKIDDDQLPPYLLDGDGVCVNGAVYWMITIANNFKDFHNCAPEVLVVFDLGSEKFRTMPIPNFIIDQPCERRDWDKWLGMIIYLLEVDGRVALLRRRNKNTVSMWMLSEDDHHHHNRNWTEVIITLPFDWLGMKTCVRFRTIPGSTGQIMVRTTSGDGAITYSCNWKKNTFTKIEIAGFPSPSGYYHIFTPFAQSLFPVNYN